MRFHMPFNRDDIVRAARSMISDFGDRAAMEARMLATRSERAGCVVNITSMAVVDPFPGLAVYAASKAALDSLTRSIHNEGADHGIRAYSVAPGAVETEMLRTIVTEEQLPTEQTLAPAQIAEVVADCIAGTCAEPSGSSLLVPSS